MPLDPPETYTHPPIDFKEIYWGLLIFMVKSTAVCGIKFCSSFLQAITANVNSRIAMTGKFPWIKCFIRATNFGFSIITLTLILIFYSQDLAAQEKPVPKRQKTEKISKWEKKARKNEAKADRIKKRLVKSQQKEKKPTTAHIRKLQGKVDKRTTKAAAARYKGKSISHAKSQTKKARKRMKKNIKKHRKYKRDH